MFREREVVIRPREILREAWRNVATGTSRPLLAVIVFTLVTGALGFVQARSVVEVADQAHQWRAAGAPIMVVALNGQIDGAQCDALTAVPGIAAAGALRQAEQLRVAVLPSTPLEAFEATPGLAAVLQVAPLNDTGLGIWVADELAETLGVSTDRNTQQRIGDDEVTIAGRYAYPSDGRAPTLAYSAVTPVAATGRFDACWVELWPESDQARTLLTLPAIGSVGSDGKPLTPQIQQLNTSLGARFDAAGRLAALPIWPLTGAAALAAAALAITLIRIRRIELAAALHAGIDTASLILQTTAETLVWAATSLALLVPFLWWAATHGNPDPPWAAFYSATRTAILASITALAATIVTTALTREKHLFRYFKNR